MMHTPTLQELWLMLMYVMIIICLGQINWRVAFVISVLSFIGAVSYCVIAAEQLGVSDE